MLMKVTAGLLAVCCSHWGDRCSGRPAHCRVPSDSPGLGVCLNYEGLQNREMKGTQGERHTKPEKVTNTFVSLTQRDDKERRGSEMRKSHRHCLTIWCNKMHTEGREAERMGELCAERTPWLLFLCSLMLTLKKEDFTQVNAGIHLIADISIHHFLYIFR